MATSGTFYADLGTGSHQLVLAWRGNQNITNNTTTITADLYLKGKSSWSTINSGSVQKPCHIGIAGNNRNFTHAINISGTEQMYLGSHTVTVTHDSDGSKQINISASLTPQIWWGNNYQGNAVYVGGNVSLDTIPRSSTLTLPSVVEYGTNLNFRINSAVTSFRHDIHMNIATAGGDVMKDISGNQSYNYFIPLDWLSKIPNQESCNGIVRVRTYNNGNLIGMKDYTVTFKAPDSVRPIVDSFTLSEANENVSQLLPEFKGNNTFLQAKSVIRANIASHGQYGAVISSYEYHFGGYLFSTNAEGTSYSLDLSTASFSAGNSEAVQVNVKDSRGKTASTSIPIKVVAYTLPTMNKVIANRKNNSDEVTVSLEGQLSTIMINDSDRNIVSLKAYRKINTDNDYDKEPFYVGTKLSAFTADGFSKTHAYDIRIVIQDALTTATYETNVATSKAIFNLHKDNGVGIGKMHERGVLDIDGDVYINNTLMQDLAHPISSVITTLNPTNPGEYLGGTWERFAKGRTLVSLDENDADFNQVGKTGGVKEQRLSALIGAVNGNTSAIGYQADSAISGQAYSYAVTGNGAPKNQINHTTRVLQNPSGAQPTTLQPYIVVYFFIRVA